MAANGKSNRTSILFGGNVGLVERLDGQNAAKVYEGRGDTRPVLIVIGGGFAGLLACRKMRREFKVVLVDAKEYFEYYPGIARAYVHPQEHRKLARHYQPICDHLGVEFAWGEALHVDVEKKSVYIKEMSRKERIEKKYDYLLVTAGSEYGINLVHAKRASSGNECLWYPTFLEEGIENSAWKGLDERFLAGRRNHLEQEYRELVALHKAKGTILVIGAGFVGVEFATEVKYYFPDIEVVIVESRNCCVGVMPKSCIDYCQAYMEKHGIKTIYGEKYTKFLCPEPAQPCSPKTPDADDLKTTLDKLPEMATAWGINEPNRIYMAVGLRAINQFLPECCLSPIKGSRGGWIKTNLHQQVLCNGKPMSDVFAAGNCCELEGLTLPKNSFPAEDMAAVACHNIRATHAKKGNGKSSGGCFGFLRPKTFKKTHWGWGTGLCATSLGPHDATMVAGSSPTPGSGRTVLWGYPSALQKEFIRWSKVDQINNGCIGALVWNMIH